MTMWGICIQDSRLRGRILQVSLGPLNGRWRYVRLEPSGLGGCRGLNVLNSCCLCILRMFEMGMYVVGVELKLFMAGRLGSDKLIRRKFH